LQYGKNGAFSAREHGKWAENHFIDANLDTKPPYFPLRLR